MPTEPTRPGPESGPPDPVEPERSHDETGLGLARSIARGMAGSRRTTKKPAAGSGSRRGFRARTDPQASGAHPDDRDPQLLDTTIGRLIAEQGWDTDVRVHGVFSRWEHLVGPDVATHCTPESFRDGKLVVRTDSTAWSTQLKLLAPTVLRRLDAELGAGTVTVIDVQGPHLPNWKKGRLSSRDGRGPRDTYG
ncbi:DUF721 domain-containing protein [soil metagenome]